MENRKALQLRILPELKAWIEIEADRNGSTQNSEIIRAIRERKERVEREQEYRFVNSDEGRSLAGQMAKVLWDDQVDTADQDSCVSLLASKGFDPNSVDLLWNRVWFDWCEIYNENVPDDRQEEISTAHHQEYPEFVK